MINTNANLSPKPNPSVGGSDGAENFYNSYAQPVWLQIAMLAPGDVVVAKTQSTTYYIFVVGTGVGVILSQSYNTDVKGEVGFNKPYFTDPQEVLLYGAYDFETSAPVWGKLQVGMPLLFAPVSSSNLATRTSPVQKLFIKKSSSRPIAFSPSSVPVTKPSLLGKGPVKPALGVSALNVQKPFPPQIAPKASVVPKIK